jgi:capsular polysaccharide transport system permease protein
MNGNLALAERSEAAIVPHRISVELPPLPRLRRRRRIGRLLSLLLAIALPTALMGTYLYRYADNQFISEFRFSVRRQAPLRVDPSAGTSMTAGLSPSLNLAMINDSEIVVQYLKSRQVIDDIAAAGIDLDRIYAQQDNDLLAHLSPNATAEERQRYWRRVVDPFFDLTNGIVSVQVRAFQPQDAQLVAAKVLQLAESLVNRMSSRAQADQLVYAQTEADDSGLRLRKVQADLAIFRNQHAVLFPEMQATVANSVEGKIEESLIEAKTAYRAQLAQGASPDARLMAMSQSRIEALEGEQQRVHGALAQAGDDHVSLASVMSGYAVLQADEATAERIHERALVALQDARNEVAQQSIYLAAFVRPDLPQESEYPMRWRVLLETAAISFVAWCLLQLIYHGIRDHLD